MNKVIKRNVLLIIPNLSFGGAQVSFHKLSEQLSLRHNVTNVVFNKDDIADYQFSSELISLGIPASKSLFKKLKNFKDRVKAISRLKKQLNIEVSISFLEGADYVNILSKGAENVILSIRGSKYHDQNISGILGQIRHKFLIPYFYNRSDSIVALNNGIKYEMEKVYKVKVPIDVVYNGFDLFEIRKNAEASLTPIEASIFDRPVIISHGRLALEKGYDYFIKVMSQIKIENLRFLLVGDGLYKSELIRLCIQLGLKLADLTNSDEITNDTKVIIFGYTENPFKLLKHGSLFVLPSLHEGFGNSLLEAMTCGLPIVASDCPYSPGEILVRQNNKYGAKYGALVPLGDNGEFILSEWVRKVEDLITNNDQLELFRLKSIERANFFDQKEVFKKWEKVIENDRNT